MPVALEQQVSKETLQAVLHIASSLVLTEAMDLLDLLDETFLKEIIYEYHRDTRPIMFSSLGHDPYNLIKPCSQIDFIWFYGGPPGRKDWFCSTASQYVADCILRSIIKMGEHIVEVKIATILKYGAP